MFLFKMVNDVFPLAKLVKYDYSTKLTLVGRLVLCLTLTVQTLGLFYFF